MPNAIDGRSVGFAAFTVATNVLRKLVENDVLTSGDARSIMEESAQMHEGSEASSNTEVNADAARLCEEFLNGVNW